MNSEAYYKLRARVAFHRFFSKIPNIKEKKIFEFGAGLGQNIFLLKNAFAYDISKSANRFAQTKGIKTLDKSKLKDNSFDIILSCHNLEHIEAPLENLKFLNKKLKKSGKLILVLPKERHHKVPLEPELVNYHLYAWNFDTINNLLDKAGFKPIKNKFYYGTGYHKLSFLSKINFRLYLFAISFFGWAFNSGDLLIIAEK